MSDSLHLQPLDFLDNQKSNRFNFKIDLSVILQSFQIQKFNKNDLTYHEFFWNFMYKNIPVVITSISNDWDCRKDWIKHENVTNEKPNNRFEVQECEMQLKENHPNHLIVKNHINFDFLKSKLGNIKVPVADCSKIYYNSHQKTEMDFHEYLNYWKNRDDTKDINDNNPLYLKDWHLKANMPGYIFYQVPQYFASDWLNEYLIDKNKDDYRFVYMGPKKSWTPFHSDVFSSYSWSTNIIGLKKWLIMPPNEELKLRDSFGNDPFTIDEDELNKKQVKYFVIEQRENESIFVPSGWYHQVWNITDTISINHNWFNGCNVQKIWQSLKNNMEKVINEIEDCRTMDNFDQHCQTMLRATFGLNYFDFLDILDHIVQKRIKSIKANDADNFYSFDIFKLNKFHLLFDLQAARKVVEQMIDVDDSVINDRHLFLICDTILNETIKYTNDEK